MARVWPVRTPEGSELGQDWVSKKGESVEHSPGSPENPAQNTKGMTDPLLEGHASDFH